MDGWMDGCWMYEERIYRLEILDGWMDGWAEQKMDRHDRQTGR